MTRYSLQALKNRITDRIHTNHERAIDGVDLQEFLHDLIDSLAGYEGESSGYGDHRSDTVFIPAGLQVIIFINPFPPGTVYTIPPLAGHTEEDDLIWQVPDPAFFSDEGFSIAFDQAVTLTYTATIVT